MTGSQTGKAAIVTGGSANIGKLFAEAGVRRRGRRRPLQQPRRADLGDPADIVPVMRFLAAPGTRWVTAQTVYVNGGMISPIN